jgi:hypothetical protein
VLYKQPSNTLLNLHESQVVDFRSIFGANKWRDKPILVIFAGRVSSVACLFRSFTHYIVFPHGLAQRLLCSGCCLSPAASELTV